jgi:hypothetical protein
VRHAKKSEQKFALINKNRDLASGTLSHYNAQHLDAGPLERLHIETAAPRLGLVVGWRLIGNADELGKI